MDSQIEEQVPTVVNLENSQTSVVKHILGMIMIDGKTCNAITDTKSAQTCNVCGATPKEMNNLKKLQTNKL